MAVARRLPAWTQAAILEYANRLPKNHSIDLVSVAPYRRTRQSVSTSTATGQEAERILSRLGPTDYVVALDERGERMTTQRLATVLAGWQDRGRPITFVIGGADGLHERCLQRADYRLSLSDFTLPHGLAQLVLVEQLYRAYTVNTHHPYHRE